jgi:4-aminobutyrate aminotransferase-like enzyme
MQSILKINAFDSNHSSVSDASILELIKRRERSFGADAPLFYANPLHVVRGQGVWLYDSDGRPFLDAYNNVPHVGHCNPDVVEAVARQAATLNTHTRYLSEQSCAYAEQLLETFPAPLSKLSLTCTGTESVDLAMRMAYKYTGGTGFIVTRFAYHGNSVAVSSISPSVGLAVPVGRDVRLVAAPDSYRHPQPSIAGRLAEQVSAAIDDLEQHGVKLAAMIIDSIFSSDGVYTDPPGFLQSAAARVRMAGGLVIADEVQPGFGRTGTHMWGFQRHALIPDIVVMGKPMGNGIPIGGVVTTPEILKAFAGSAGYFNTFGGNGVSCAAGHAVLNVLRRDNLLQNATDVGGYLKRQLQAVAGVHECIGDVRGAGLYLSVEFVTQRDTREPDAPKAAAVINALRNRGVLVGGTGAHANMLKIRPPLVFSRENADLLVLALDDILRTGGE